MQARPATASAEPWSDDVNVEVGHNGYTGVSIAFVRDVGAKANFDKACRDANAWLPT